MYGKYPPYVSVAKRREKAKRAMDKLRKKGAIIRPIEIEGRAIATTFWGKAWCSHLERFSDYSNRLPRGRTYARNGSVCHLNVEKGVIEAIVNGSTLYNIKIEIKPLAKSQWKKLQEKCAGEIGSLLELLQGRISSSVMSTVTDTSEGLFPLAKEIDFDCDCPDSAYMCKHIAAVLYGIGARLDHAPELLFLLREVNHEDLISSEVSLVTDKTNRKKLKGDLSDIFDIELDAGLKKPTKKVTKKATTPKSSPLKSTAKAKKKPSKTNLKKKQQTITATSIRRLKKKLGLNNTEFARLLEVSSATVARWEKQTGQLNLRDHNRERILFVLEMDINSALEIIDPL